MSVYFPSPLPCALLNGWKICYGFRKELFIYFCNPLGGSKRRKTASESSLKDGFTLISSWPRQTSLFQTTVSQVFPCVSSPPSGHVITSPRDLRDWQLGFVSYSFVMRNHGGSPVQGTLAPPGVSWGSPLASQRLKLTQRNRFKLSDTLKRHRLNSSLVVFPMSLFRLDERPSSKWRPQLSQLQFQSLLHNLTAIKIRTTFGEDGQYWFFWFGFDSSMSNAWTRSTLRHPHMSLIYFIYTLFLIFLMLLMLFLDVVEWIDLI